MKIIRVEHICDQTFEKLKLRINQYISGLNDNEFVESVDTHFDGNMVNAYIKIGGKE